VPNKVPIIDRSVKKRGSSSHGGVVERSRAFGLKNLQPHLYVRLAYHIAAAEAQTQKKKKKWPQKPTKDVLYLN